MCKIKNKGSLYTRRLEILSRCISVYGQPGLQYDTELGILSGGVLHVLPVFTWASFGLSGSLQPPKNMLLGELAVTLIVLKYE